MIMAKRFTDSEKWKKRWFRTLSNRNKVFWMYLLDQCDHAGIWEVDFELAGYFCQSIDENEIRGVFKKQYREFDDGKRWFVHDFVDFQYGELNPNVNAHKSVINRLNKHSLFGVKGAKNSSSTVEIARKSGYKTKGKREQLLEIQCNFIDLGKEFPGKNVKKEFDDWTDYMLSAGKTYKNYNATFRRWLRETRFDSKEEKQYSNNIKFRKTPTGLFIAFCKKCGKKQYPNDRQLKMNASCCAVGYSPEPIANPNKSTVTKAEYESVVVKAMEEIA